MTEVMIVIVIFGAAINIFEMGRKIYRNERWEGHAALAYCMFNAASRLAS